MTRLTGRFMPPPALASLGSNDVLIAQAEELESFANTESSLSETEGARARFWRASAALRFAALLHVSDPQTFYAACAVVDRERMS